MLSATVFCASAFALALLPPSVISPALAGLSLAYGLTLNEAITFWAWWAAQLENKIICVERIRQMSSLHPEAPQVVEAHRPPPSWPSQGRLEFRELSVRYREGMPLVLRSLSCSIGGGEKVGVVGRTGSGKSTLVQALFRMLEAEGGGVFIDGLNTAKMGLHDLRTKLSILPQV